MNVRELLNYDEKLYVSRQDFSVKTAVQRLVNNDLYVRQKERNFAPLSAAQCNDVEKYWRDKLLWHMDLLNMKWFEVYNAVEKDRAKLKYYIPDSFFYAFIDEYFTNPQRSTALDDKNLYDLYFADIKRPATLARKINDVFMDENYNPITVDNFFQICKDSGNVVIKSAIGSFGGHGVMFWNAEKDNIEQLLDFVSQKNSKEFKGSNEYRQYIIQSVVEQHPTMAAINGSSINTVRIITLYRNGVCKPLSSVLRMGINGSRVDNCSSGGIVCGIDASGCLKNVAYDAQANAYYKHPQGFEFAGVKVPGYAMCVELAKKLACRLYGASRLISWDFAIGTDAEPILIEMNISFGEIDFHQLCNGPILGDDTDDILKEVVDKNITLQHIFDYIDDNI